MSGGLVLAPVLGDGSKSNPYCHRYREYGGIDLRSPDGDSSGYFLTWLPERVRDSRLTWLCQHPNEPVSSQSKRFLGNRLRLDLNGAANWAAMLRELLTEHAGNGRLCLPLRPAVEQQRHELWIGNKLVCSWEAPPRKSSIRLPETFPATGNGFPTGADLGWTLESAAGSGNVVDLGGGVRVMRCNAAGTGITAIGPSLHSEHHEIYVTFTLGAEAANNEVQVRTRRTTAGGGSFYRTLLRRNSTPSHSREQLRRVAGTNTVIQSDTTDPGATGTIWMSSDGSTQRSGSTVYGTPLFTNTDTNVIGILTPSFSVVAPATVANAQLHNDMILRDHVLKAVLALLRED